MSSPPLEQPLTFHEVQVLSRLARQVDRSLEARAILRASGSLDEAIDVACSLGFPELSTELLIRASHHLSDTGWVWQKTAQSWSDHLYVLALTSLLDSQIRGAGPRRAPRSSAIELPATRDSLPC